MPTSTLSQLIFHNVGPLTTTWTAPTSCATITPAPQLARSSFDLAPGRGYYSERCDAFESEIFNECIPSASEMNEEWLSKIGSPQQNNVVFFHSPGVVCPAAWSSVGVAARHNTSSYSLNGVFADPTETFTVDGSTTTVTQFTPGLEPHLYIFMSALEPKETAVLCCPSGYTANWAGAGCFSEVPRSLYTATTGCQLFVEDAGLDVVTVTYTFHGRPVTGQGISIIGTTIHYGTIVDTIAPDQSSSFGAIVNTPAVALVHREQDVVQTGIVHGSGSATDESSATGTPNAAVSSGRSAGKLASVVLTAWGFAFVAGVALMIPC